MKAAIPLYAIVNVMDLAHAARIKQQLETLLGQDFIKQMISAQGVPLVGVQAGDAYQVPDNYQVPKK